MKKRSPLLLVVVILVGVAILLFAGSVAVAQEHTKSKTAKEHPQEKSAAEHPQEHPQEKSTTEQPQEHPEEHPVKMSKVAVTKENLAAAIHDYVAKEMKKNDGAFLCVDDRTDDTLRLTLKKVHEERLATLGNDTYFACADFIREDGKVYDLDIFMSGKSMDKLVPTEVAVHKEDGVERYTWSEVEGVWKKVPVKK